MRPRWVYHLSTRQLEPGIYVIIIEMPDGQRYRTAFVLRDDDDDDSDDDSRGDE